MNRFAQIRLLATSLPSLAAVCILGACSNSSLNKTPDGFLSQNQVTTPAARLDRSTTNNA